MRSHRFRVILFCILSLLCGNHGLRAKNYVAAKALSGHLKPQGLTPKADPGGLEKLRGQVTNILNAMEQSQVQAGPGAEDLLDTAYDMFRPDVGPVHRTAATAALVAIWSEARALGAFDEKNKFTGRITRGVDSGQAVVFEHIVPPGLAPAFSRDLANVRIVAPGRKRADGAKTTAREEAYLNTLKAIEREVAGMKSLAKIEDGPKTNAVGQTLQEAHKIWQEAMQRDGDKAREMPSIVLLGRLLSTPSNRNDDRWIAQAEVTNLSLHATEVELECIFMGTTDKGRKNYLMGEVKQKLEMRAGEAMKIHLATPLREKDYKNRTDDYEQLSKTERKLSQANYRGVILRVNHARGVAATFATDPVMLDYLDKDAEKKLDSLPKLYLDPKTWPKYTPPDAEKK